jgi:hypothetical protein
MSDETFPPPAEICEGADGASRGGLRPGEFSPSSVLVFWDVVWIVSSVAEAVSLSGRMGRVKRPTRIASETSKTEAFGVPNTCPKYNKRSRFTVRMKA